MAGGLIGFSGSCWRAVAAGREAGVLEGTTRAGRYNRPGVRALYMSGSREGVAAAMARYGEASRTVLRLEVTATRLVDLRDAAACAALQVDATQAKEDWVAAMARGEEPASWAVADAVRSVGAEGLIDGSRRLPGAWHLVLFRWNEVDGATVEIAR